MLLLIMGQMLAQLSLIKVITTNAGNGIALVMLGIALFVGVIFGCVEFFCKGGRHILPSTKLISIVINAGIYRFFFFAVKHRGAMAGAAAFQFAYKVVVYYVYFFGFDKIHGLWKNHIGKMYFNKDIIPKIHYFNSQEEKDAAQIKLQRYILDKFIVSQNSDLFFAISTLILLLCSRYWLPGLYFGFGLQISEFNFYLGLVLLEITVDTVMWIHFMLAAKKVLQKKVTIMKVSIVKEILKILEGRTMVVIAMKVLIMFLLLFISMNGL